MPSPKISYPSPYDEIGKDINIYSKSLIFFDFLIANKIPNMKYKVIPITAIIPTKGITFQNGKAIVNKTNNGGINCRKVVIALCFLFTKTFQYPY